MNIKMTRFKNKLTVELEGKLDANTSPELEEKLKPELKETGYLIVDMQNLKYISSACLRVLVWAVQTLDEHGGTMILTNVSDEIKKVFELTGLLSVFDIK